MLFHVVDVASDRVVGVLDRPPAGAARLEQRLDLELVGVGQLVPPAVEDLDAVVLGRVVRGGDHQPEVLREQGDRRCR